MAFAFFRKRQKMVIIIMVLLMVSFLVGVQGLNMLLSKKPGERVIGTVGDDEIIQQDSQRAADDLELLSRYVRLGTMGPSSQIRPTNAEFIDLARGTSPQLALTLLQYEAGRAGITVSEREANDYMGQLRTLAEIDSLQRELRSGEGVAYRDVIAALRRWLAVYKFYADTVIEAPPSEAEIRQLFRELREEVDLRVARVSAESLFKDVPEPSRGDIEALLKAHGASQPGTVSPQNEFGFGYQLPDRVQITYLLIRESVLRRVTRPSGDEITDRYLKEPDRFTKEVWRGAGEAAEKFLLALADGDKPAAANLTVAGSAAAKQIAKFRPITPAGEAAITEVLIGAGGSSALAVSSTVLPVGKPPGPMVVRLSLRTVGWRVVGYSFGPEEAAGKAQVDFRKAHSDAVLAKKATEKKKPHEAEAEIIEEILDVEIARSVGSTVGKIRRRLTDAVGKDAYQSVLEEMKHPAVLDKALSEKLLSAIDGVSLERAIEMLGQAGGQGRICYPWGKYGKTTIDPKIRVALKASPVGRVTLGDALAQIDRQVFGRAPTRGATTRSATTKPAATQPTSRPAPPVTLKWATCDYFPGLFPVDGPDNLNLFPLQVGTTELAELGQVRGHEILGSALATPTGESGEGVAAAAFSMTEFHKGRDTGARVRLNEEGEPMYVSGPHRGRLLWRPIRAVPAAAPDPKDIDKVPGLKKRLVEDAKTPQAYKLAVAKAKKIAEEARKLNLSSAAMAENVKTTTTGSFPRKTLSPLARDPRLRAFLTPETVFTFSWVQGVGQDGGRNAAFMDKAFSLVPDDPEAPFRPPGRVATVPMKSEAAVLVIQCIGYKPPLEQDYSGMGRFGWRQQIAGTLVWTQQSKMRRIWFEYEKIADRLKFELKKRESKKDEKE